MTDDFGAAKTRVFAALREALSNGSADAVTLIGDALLGDATMAEPPATPADDEANGEGTAEEVKPKFGEPERSTFELVVRMFLEEECLTRKRGGVSIADCGVPPLLDLAIDLAVAEVAEFNTPFVLIEDLLDSQVISESEQIFGLLEARAGQLSQFLAASAGGRATRAKLTLLRMCNELLRRLSKSKNTNFCGRVLLMMAYALPISERSGVNLKGATAEFALGYAKEDEEGGIEEPAVSASAGAGDAKVGFDFYSTFWGLQRAFAEPATAVGNESWKPLVKNVEAVLQVFSAFGSSSDITSDSAADTNTLTATPAAAAASEEAADDVATMEVDQGAAVQGEALQEVYFAKFLTSPKLINLQLRDAYFRRHLLVQLRIFLQTISTERKGFPSLSSSQREAVEALTKRSADLLRSVPPGGPSFSATLDTLLSRESHWMKWKGKGCQAFDKVAVTASRSTTTKRKVNVGSRPSKRLQMGTSELTKLWNLGSNSLEDVSTGAQRKGVPSLEEYLQPVIDQADPAAGIEDQYKMKNDKVFCWKALRLMAKKDVSLLAKVSAPNGSLEAAASHFAEKSKDGAVVAPVIEESVV